MLHFNYKYIKILQIVLFIDIKINRVQWAHAKPHRQRKSFILLLFTWVLFLCEYIDKVHKIVNLKLT